MAHARLGVDVGGTFTDLALVEDGRLVTTKVLSTPADQSAGVLAAWQAAATDPASISAFAHGMTVATNALLERRGARTALVTTHGFRDVIEIGRQNRPSLYDLTADRPPSLVPRELRFTVRERMGPDGPVVPLDQDSLAEVLTALAETDVESVAVCLLFAFAHPEHEQRVGAAIRDALPELHVSLSSEVLPEFREFERFSTTTADAYLAPRLDGYLRSLRTRSEAAGLPEPLVMQSSGGVVRAGSPGGTAAAFVLSGPAGGVVGAAHVAGLSGYQNVLTFDMGGTSTDVALIEDGQARTTTESVLAGVPLRLPMVDVHTVSAGGGSIAWADAGGALRVGPHSAGADPGPACYDRGGQEPTVTDANLFLGYLPDDARLGDDAEAVVLRRARAADAIERLAAQLELDPLDTAQGILQVADAQMVQALRVVSVERGIDPRQSSLVAFGGAGGLHSCSLAEALGISTVLVPRTAGVLSALGLAMSGLRRDLVRPVRSPVDALDAAVVTEAVESMTEEAAADLSDPETTVLADVRYQGQSFELTVPAMPLDGLAERFHAEHLRRYGYQMADQAAEVLAIRLVASVEVPRPTLTESAHSGDPVTGRRDIVLDGESHSVPVLSRDLMGAGATLKGPAVVEFPDATALVRHGWRGRVDDVGTLVLERT